MVSWGGLGGLAPPGISVSLALPPGGGLGGFAPSGISVNYPCLASAAAVPCPRALPPIFFRPNFFVRIFSSEFFRRNFFVRIFFVRRRSVVRPSVVRRPSVCSFVRPSVQILKLILSGVVVSFQSRQYTTATLNEGGDKFFVPIEGFMATIRNARLMRRR